MNTSDTIPKFVITRESQFYAGFADVLLAAPSVARLAAFKRLVEADAAAYPDAYASDDLLRALLDAPKEARVDGLLQTSAGVPLDEERDNVPEGSIVLRLEARSRAYRDALRIDGIVADALAPIGWRVLEKRVDGNALCYVVFNPAFSPAFPQERGFS